MSQENKMAARDLYRHPEVGDMVIQSNDNTHKKWTGVVYKIKRNEYGHGTAFLHWLPDPPPFYNKEYGIPCVNIHNRWDVYDVIKKS